MIRALAGLLSLVVLAGCTGGKSSGTGEKFESVRDLQPDAAIAQNASLKIGQVDVPVAVVQSTETDRMILALEAHGQVFEREVYRVAGDSFDLVEGAGEVYEDPLPILKFPLAIGDAWSWKGKMSSGNEPHDASAKIATSSEPLLLPAEGSTPSVLVVVDLEISGAGPTPATRKLRFWFVKGKGLVKRQFGIASTREPAK